MYFKMNLLILSVSVVLYSIVADAEANRIQRTVDELRNENKRILLEDNYYTLVNTVQTLQTEVASLKSELANVHNLESEVANLKSNLVRKSSTPVVFRARLTQSISSMQAKQLIVFDEVQFNTGHGYHHGTFVAPLNGTYLFSISLCTPANHWIEIDLLRNGVKVGQVTTGDDKWNACSSETSVTDLNAGDDVTVQHYGSTGGLLVSEGHLNSFTGVLLYAA